MALFLLQFTILSYNRLSKINYAFGAYVIYYKSKQSSLNLAQYSCILLHTISGSLSKSKPQCFKDISVITVNNIAHTLIPFTYRYGKPILDSHSTIRVQNVMPMSVYSIREQIEPFYF